MPHAVWSGAISFGLVTIPIRVTTATEDHSMRFHQYHLEDQGRIRTRKYCEIEEREVSMAEIGKGYEVSKDTLIAVTDEDLANLPLTTAKAIEIVAFVPYSDIDPIRIGEGYYLEPDGQVATKPYTLLRKALERNSKAAVARFAWRGRERLGLLRVRENAIVLHSMRWPDEIRSSESLAPLARRRPRGGDQTGARPHGRPLQRRHSRRRRSRPVYGGDLRPDHRQGEGQDTAACRRDGGGARAGRRPHGRAEGVGAEGQGIPR